MDLQWREDIALTAAFLKTNLASSDFQVEGWEVDKLRRSVSKSVRTFLGHQRFLSLSLTYRSFLIWSGTLPCSQ